MRHSQSGIRLRLGKRVKQLRLLHGLGQEALAERAGISHKHVGEVERGRVNVTLDILEAIAIQLGVDVPDLFEPRLTGSGNAFIVTLTQRDVEQVRRGLHVIDRATQQRAPRQPSKKG